MCLHSHNSQHFLGPHRSLFANCSNQKYQINHCLHHLAETTYDQNVKLGTNTADDSGWILFFAALSQLSFSHPLLLWPPLPHLSRRATFEKTLKGLASHCKAEATFTFHSSILSLLNAF